MENTSMALLVHLAVSHCIQQIEVLQFYPMEWNILYTQYSYRVFIFQIS